VALLAAARDEGPGLVTLKDSGGRSPLDLVMQRVAALAQGSAGKAPPPSSRAKLVEAAGVLLMLALRSSGGAAALEVTLEDGTVVCLSGKEDVEWLAKGGKGSPSAARDARAR
jgi:hypothetical protein